LAGAEPQRVSQLASMWQAWAQRASVLPLNPTKPGIQKKTNKRVPKRK